jgi:hypothetical protein
VSSWSRVLAAPMLAAVKYRCHPGSPPAHSQVICVTSAHAAPLRTSPCCARSVPSALYSKRQRWKSVQLLVKRYTNRASMAPATVYA